MSFQHFSLKDRLVATVCIDRKRNDDSSNTGLARRASLDCWLQYSKFVGADACLVRTWEGAKELQHLDPTWARLAVHRQLVPLYRQSLVADCDILWNPESWKRATDDVFESMGAADFMAFDQEDYRGRPEQPGIHAREVVTCAQAGMDVRRWLRNPARQNRHVYMNTGVLVVRESCATLWDRVELSHAEATSRTFPEQNWTNWRLMTSGLKFQAMPERFNWMRPGNPASTRFDGTFIHYAGEGWIEETGVNRYDMMVDDFRKLYNREPRPMEEMLPEFKHVL